ncbi:hypothetical protein ACF07B_36170 [Streptomyces sp. NPDC015532]|uniref:hypothetical protein n=1 Tax=Streptomyces sp. NPDC015532 TaxID=3364960 RepID=UPI0036F6D3B4
MKLPRYAKAIVAAVVAGSGTLAAALNDGTVTATEAFTVDLAVLGAPGITLALPNRQVPPSSGGPSTEA